MAKSTVAPKKNMRPNARWSIDQLRTHFEMLEECEFPYDKVKHEREKLFLMEVFHQKLVLQTNRKKFKSKDAEKDLSFWRRLLVNMVYYFLLLFGLLQDATASYTFGAFLFGLIPTISNPLIIICAVFYTLIECALFYAFEVSLLKDLLDMPNERNGAGLLIDTYSDQIKVLVKINQQLTSLATLVCTEDDFNHYVILAKLLNASRIKIYDAIASHRLSKTRKILKVGIIAFGVLTNIAGSYYFVLSSLAAVAPTLVGTPLGWGLIVLTILAGIGFYFAMGGSAMANILNQDYDRFQVLKKDISDFKENHADELSNIAAIRNKFVSERPKGVNKATQTTPQPIPARSHHSGLGFFPMEAVLEGQGSVASSRASI